MPAAQKSTGGVTFAWPAALVVADHADVMDRDRGPRDPGAPTTESLDEDRGLVRWGSGSADDQLSEPFGMVAELLAESNA